ncbi:MAG: divalent cation tolerance protein CutA, partial [Planctomycetes bacterium]|nr:divalent cation tolerance protein CutA [Planctomycetota bacterium]
MYIAWTTTSKMEDANLLARGAVEAGLDVCTAIDGPLTTCYCWKGEVEEDR